MGKGFTSSSTQTELNRFKNLVHVPGTEGATGHVGENLEGGPVGEEVEGVAEEDRLHVRDGVDPRHVAEYLGLLLDHTCRKH